MLMIQSCPAVPATILYLTESHHGQRKPQRQDYVKPEVQIVSHDPSTDYNFFKDPAPVSKVIPAVWSGPDVDTDNIDEPGQDYEIQWGDTLSGLARRWDTTVKDIVKVNPYIKDPNKIYAGKKLIKPSGPLTLMADKFSDPKTVTDQGLPPDDRPGWRSDDKGTWRQLDKKSGITTIYPKGHSAWISADQIQPRSKERLAALAKYDWDRVRTDPEYAKSIGIWHPEQENIKQERKLTKNEKSKLKSSEKKVPKKPFIDRYGEDEGKQIYYATLTKRAKSESKNFSDYIKLVEAVTYNKPQFDVEWEEANRYPYLEKLGQAGWIDLAESGKELKVTKANVGQIDNTDAADYSAWEELEQEKRDRFVTAVKEGKVEMPIVMETPDGKLELIAGNTRLTGMLQEFGEATVWFINASQLKEAIPSGPDVEKQMQPLSPEEKIMNAVKQHEQQKDMKAIIKMLKKRLKKKKRLGPDKEPEWKPAPPFGDEFIDRDWENYKKGKPSNRMAQLEDDVSNYKPKVFVDMDGVLANFFDEWEKMLGVGNWRDVKDPNEALKALAGTDFFATLPKFPGKTDDLVTFVNEITNGNWYILSSPLRWDREGSTKHKQEWLLRNLPIQPKDAIFDGMKERYAIDKATGQPNILIDDHSKYIQRWTDKGGIGIQYKAKSDSVEKVKQFLKDHLGTMRKDVGIKEAKVLKVEKSALMKSQSDRVFNRPPAEGKAYLGPTHSDLKALLQKHSEIRGSVFGDQVVIWPAIDANHGEYDASLEEFYGIDLNSQPRFSFFISILESPGSPTWEGTLKKIPGTDIKWGVPVLLLPFAEKHARFQRMLVPRNKEVQEISAVGIITKQNTTKDVKPGETKRQAKKLKLVSSTIEGKSPHKKGTKKYKNHMAAMHANMGEVAMEEAEIDEGVNDPGIFKAIFTAGGPGSGKSFVVDNLITGFGLKKINSDDVFEWKLEKAGYEKDPETIAGIAGQELRAKAKELTKKRQEIYMDGRLGLIVDGTGKDVTKMDAASEKLKQAGYETLMVFVNTSIEVAQYRNTQRPRQLRSDVVKEIWHQAQENMMKYQQIFGRNNFIIVDNSGGLEDPTRIKQFAKVYNNITNFVKATPRNPMARKWIEQQRANPGGQKDENPQQESDYNFLKGAI